MEFAVSIDDKARVWRVEARIPMSSVAAEAPAPGTRWRINFYRHDTANEGFMAFSPTLTDTFHTPSRYGWIVLGD
jgi:hypothetical protein